MVSKKRAVTPKRNRRHASSKRINTGKLTPEQVTARIERLLAQQRGSVRNTSLNIRIEPELIAIIAVAAEQDERSVSNWIRTRLLRMAKQELGIEDA